jgi:hypothetical protein
MMYLMFILSLCVDSYLSVDLQFWMCSLWYALFLAWGGNLYHTIYGVTMTKGFTVKQKAPFCIKITYYFEQGLNSYIPVYEKQAKHTPLY